MSEINNPASRDRAGIEVTPEMIEAATRVLWESGHVEYKADGPMQLVVREIFDAAFKARPAGGNL